MAWLHAVVDVPAGQRAAMADVWGGRLGGRPVLRGRVGVRARLLLGHHRFGWEVLLRGRPLAPAAGRQAIPKSVTPSRIAENFDIFDFELTADQLAALDGLDAGVRGGPEPEQITRESFGREIPEA